MVELIHARLPLADVHVLTPSMFGLGDWWATYEPSPAEIKFQILRRGCTRLTDAFDAASRYTWHANELSLGTPLARISELVDCRGGGEVLFCGFSNGAVLATAAALRSPGKTRGLWMASGTPTPSQSQHVLDGAELRAAVTAGTHETHLCSILAGSHTPSDIPALFQKVRPDTSHIFKVMQLCVIS